MIAAISSFLASSTFTSFSGLFDDFYTLSRLFLVDILEGWICDEMNLRKILFVSTYYDLTKDRRIERIINKYKKTEVGEKISKIVLKDDYSELISAVSKSGKQLIIKKRNKNKEYSFEECEKNIVYLFNDYEEFKSYFELNGFSNMSDDLLNLCNMKAIKKGTIIALKGLCDHAIRQHNLKATNNSDYSTTKKQKFDILTVPCDRKLVVSQEKSQDFKNYKPNTRIRQNSKEMINKLKINNLKNEGPVLMKTIGTYKK